MMMVQPKIRVLRIAIKKSPGSGNINPVLIQVFWMDVMVMMWMYHKPIWQLPYQDITAVVVAEYGFMKIPLLILLLNFTRQHHITRIIGLVMTFKFQRTFCLLEPIMRIKKPLSLIKLEGHTYIGSVQVKCKKSIVHRLLLISLDVLFPAYLIMDMPLWACLKNIRDQWKS